MQLISVSRGDLAAGQDFAESLASKLSFHCLGRQQLLEAATDEGIAVGKLETAVVKRRALDERLILEKEHYLAFVTKMLCERALAGSLVYHGRVCHLNLLGVPHILRVHTVSDPESRIDEVMRRLSVDRDKAKDYVEAVDHDIHRWVRTMYAVPFDPVEDFDLVVNLDRVGVASATTALCHYAQLPEFQATPAAVRALQDALLAAQVRLALARAEATWSACFQVRADGGLVTVTYQPKDAAIGARAPEVIGSVAGVKDLTCTMASTNILWVQERFEPGGSTFESIVTVASRWNAVVELLRLEPSAEGSDGEEGSAAEDAAAAEPIGVTTPAFVARTKNGGIEDDVQGTAAADKRLADVSDVVSELNARGVAGSGRVVPANARRVGDMIDLNAPYSMVVVGDVFLDKGHSTRVRMTRELVGRFEDAVKAPVVGSEDLSRQASFGVGFYARIVGLAAVVVATFMLVFSHQEEVQRFLTPDSFGGKALAVVALLLFVPLFAMIYGTLTKSILRLLHVE